MYKSPNGTIRAILDGTVFRAPIVVKGIEPCVKNWKKPITIARHAYGDVDKNTEMYIDGPGDAYLVFEGADGQQRKELIHHYEGPGVLQGMHNLDDSITSFARCCFNYALDTKQNLWLGGKMPIAPMISAGPLQPAPLPETSWINATASKIIPAIRHTMEIAFLLALFVFILPSSFLFLISKQKSMRLRLFCVPG